MRYNWQQKDWPNFRFSLGKNTERDLHELSARMGRVSGLLTGLPQPLRLETLVETLVTEAVKTSEIEGEYLNRQDVMSSVRNNLGLARERVRDQRAAGIGELMVEVRNGFSEPLTAETLFAWHRMVMKGSADVQVGHWRTRQDPMQVVSGPLGRQRVHFEAPPSDRVPSEMENFVRWFNRTAPGGEEEMTHPAVRAALVHLYFESVHPFEDGNGRVGRALAEKALAQSLGRRVVLSLSRTLEMNKKTYYAEIEKAQRSNELSEWVSYFAAAVLEAQKQAEQQVEFTLKKVQFLDRFRTGLNERQLKAVLRMLEEGSEGGMSARKYMSLTRASKPTATRDLQDLVAKGALSVSGGGRSVSYSLNLEEPEI